MTTSQRPLTPTQKVVLIYMRHYFAENDQLPSNKAIKEAFGYSSDNSALLIQKSLARKGFIERNAVGKYRFTRLPLPSPAPIKETA